MAMVMPPYSDPFSMPLSPFPFNPFERNNHVYAALAGPSSAPPPFQSPPSHHHVDYDPASYVALDAEFVGVGQGGLLSALARVSVVDWDGKVLLDTHCAVEQVTDYRSWVSGIRELDLLGAPGFAVVQSKVRDIIKGKVLVGHAVHNDLEVLELTHPQTHTRDTAHYEPLHRLSGTHRPSLRALAKIVLSVDVQMGEHSSVEDARATMSIFRAYQQQWEASLDHPAPLLRRHNTSPHRSSPYATHSHDRPSPLTPRGPSTPTRAFSSPTGGLMPRVNLPSPLATPPGSRLNPQLDPRFSAAAMSLPTKPQRSPTDVPASISPPPAPREPKASAFQPLPPPQFNSGFFHVHGQSIEQAFPPLDARQPPSPPLSSASSSDSARRRKVVGLAPAKKPSSRRSRERKDLLVPPTQEIVS